MSCAESTLLTRLGLWYLLSSEFKLQRGERKQGVVFCAWYIKMCKHENKAYLEFSLSSLMYGLIVRTQSIGFFPPSVGWGGA